MENLYLIFDKMPQLKDGGLATAYINFVKALNDNYNIKIVCIFGSTDTDIEDFRSLESTSLCTFDIDNRFYALFSHVKSLHFIKALKALVSGIIYFCFIPLGKKVTRRLLCGSIVIATCPAAAMFLSHKIRYILEIHTSFDYFWGRNPIGRMQVALVPEPVLTVFKNAHDAKKGSELFRSDYVYNWFDTSHLMGGLPKPSYIPHSAIMMGRLENEKNIPFAIAAAKEILRRYEDFQLDIYGDGSQRDDIQEMIDHEHLSDHVHLRGFTHDKTIYQSYCVLWVTSLFEGFSLNIAEAMANGVPSISTNWGEAVNEVIINETTGYIASDAKEFVEKSMAVFSQDQLRCELSQKGLEYFESHFTTQSGKTRWLHIIEEVYSTS